MTATTGGITLRQLEERCRQRGTTISFKRYGIHAIIIREDPV